MTYIGLNPDFHSQKKLHFSQGKVNDCYVPSGVHCAAKQCFQETLCPGVETEFLRNIVL
jgi:hypothetical protein